jgi:membrane-associated phospholipid phosphatase
MPSGHTQAAAAFATFMTFQLWNTERGLMADDSGDDVNLPEKLIKRNLRGWEEKTLKSVPTLLLWVFVAATMHHRFSVTKCHTGAQTLMGLLAGASVGALGDYYKREYLP